MTKYICSVLIAAICTLISNLAWGQYYNAWFTNHETTANGDTVWYETGDTIGGNVRSNECLAIRGRPVFYGSVMTTCDDFIHGENFNPEFLGEVDFHVPMVVRAHNTAENLRQYGLYINPGPHKQVRAVFNLGQVTLYKWNLGVPFDSTDEQTVPIGTATCIFVDCPLQVKGIVSGAVTLGSSSDIEIIDNILYQDARAFDGRTAATSRNYLGLVAEGNIKIANTTANGRINSNGEGHNQQNRNYSSIVITAALEALGGSLTFGGQNDPDSGYVCDCAPDYRGIVHIFGSVYQNYHGFLRRTFNSGTGYDLSVVYDVRFTHQRPPCFYDQFDYPESTDTVDFGDVIIGTTVYDTAQVHVLEYSTLGAVYASTPFHAQRIEPFAGNHFTIPISITPTTATTYRGILSVSTTYQFFQIVLRARGIIPHTPPPLSLEASPNPFNLSTILRYVLSDAGTVKIVLYDILGRAARQYEFFAETNGEHLLHIDADGLASGVYFVRMDANHQVVTQKILLIK